MSEKPIYVQVAEALGEDTSHAHFKALALAKGDPACSYKCMSCGEAWTRVSDIPDSCSNEFGRRYDTDWAVTGPLVEKYSLGVQRMAKASDPPLPGDNWVAMTPSWMPTKFADGLSPLLAICHLIIALHKEGKLPK